MNRPFSVYLDLVRFGAAVLVYLWHSNRRLLVAHVLPASNYGHSAVIVFFVLSGFVIAYVTDTKERTWVAYSASRLSRVYSVVLPTLVLTLLLDTLGRQLYPAIYVYPYDRFALRLLGCGLMLNEWWWVSITFFSNVPYWSIAFEFWYYVVFALATFLPRGWRMGAVLVACAFVGPKIVVLMPIWWAGVMLYRWRWPQTWSKGLSLALLLFSTVGIAWMHAAGVYEWATAFMRAWLGEERFTELTFAHFAPADYLLAVLVFTNFAAMRGLAAQLAPPLLMLERPVRWLAGYTFSLYLLHQPLLLFWTAIVHGNPDGYGFWLLVTGLTALSVVAIGAITEHRRAPLRRWIQQALQRLDDRARLLRTARL